jgi:hypothetical protein
MKKISLRLLYLALATSLVATGCKKKEAETDTTATTTETTTTAQMTTKEGTVVEKIFGKDEAPATTGNKYRFQPDNDNTTMLRLTKASAADGAAQAEAMEIDLSTMANKKVTVSGSEFGAEWVYNATVSATK